MAEQPKKVRVELRIQPDVELTPAERKYITERINSAVKLAFPRITKGMGLPRPPVVDVLHEQIRKRK